MGHDANLIEANKQTNPGAAGFTTRENYQATLVLKQFSLPGFIILIWVPLVHFQVNLIFDE